MMNKTIQDILNEFALTYDEMAAVSIGEHARHNTPEFTVIANLAEIHSMALDMKNLIDESLKTGISLPDDLANSADQITTVSGIEFFDRLTYIKEHRPEQANSKGLEIQDRMEQFGIDNPEELILKTKWTSLLNELVSVGEKISEIYKFNTERGIPEGENINTVVGVHQVLMEVVTNMMLAIDLKFAQENPQGLDEALSA